MVDAKFVKEEYNAKIRKLNSAGFDYEEVRWNKSKISKRTYLQTLKSIRSILKNKKFNNFLEVGCGPGVWTDLFLKKSKKITVLDISEEMIKKIKKKYKNKHCIKFICGDFVSLKLDKLFDAIYLIRVFEYFQNKKTAVRKLIKIVKKGGEIVIITKNPNFLPKRIFDLIKKITPPRLFDIITKRNRLFKIYNNLIHTDWISSKNLKKEFLSQGIKKIKVFPVVNILSIFLWKFCNTNNLAYKREMNPFSSPFIESYMLYVRK